MATNVINSQTTYVLHVVDLLPLSASSYKAALKRPLRDVGDAALDTATSGGGYNAKAYRTASGLFL